MTHTKHRVAAWLLVVAALTLLTASLITDTSGANLELAPLFVGAAVAATAVRMYRTRLYRSRSGRRRS